MVAFCCRFAVTPHIMRRRHLESVSAALYGQCFASFVSSRSLAARGSWGTAPSVFWYGVPGGTQGPLGKGGAAERWRVAYPIGIATRYGAKPATTRTHKRNASAASRTGFAPCIIFATPKVATILIQKFFYTLSSEKSSPRGKRYKLCRCKRLRPAARRFSPPMPHGNVEKSHAFRAFSVVLRPQMCYYIK